MVKFRSFYLLLLGICIGAELAIGIFMAPVIFYPSQYIGEGVLSHYQSGQLMTQVFLKYNVMLIFISSLIFLFEIVNLKNSESFNYKISAFFLALIITLLAMAFVFYFTPLSGDLTDFFLGFPAVPPILHFYKCLVLPVLLGTVRAY